MHCRTLHDSNDECEMQLRAVAEGELFLIMSEREAARIVDEALSGVARREERREGVVRLQGAFSC